MMLAMDTLRFEAPGYLVLLATLPLVIVLALRSMSGLDPVRRVLAIVLRCAVVALMVLALAGALRASRTDAISVVFVLDRSSSVPRAEQGKAFEFVRSAAKALRPTKDRVGVVAFDGASAVEQLPMGALGIDRLSEPIEPDKTGLAAALRMAMALFTGDTSRRIVVLSDGNENVGQALAEADTIAAAGVPVDVVPLRYEHGDEVVFERLSAPATATSDETINLHMVLRSQRPTRGRILLYHNDRLIDLDPSSSSAGYPVELDAGPNRLTIPVPLRVAGAHRFRALFEPENPAQDTISSNNEGRAFTVVSGQGRVLILTQGGTADTADDMDSARILARALESEKLVCDVQIAGAQPLDQVSLLEYALVILSNVPANLLSDAERQALAVYVRDLGGGLVMIGGDDSFGAGGWLDTPVEEVMPVRFDVKSKKQIPKGALALVMHACEIPQGNYVGQRVAIAAVKTLSSQDLVGVLSYQWQGGDQGYWIVPLQEVRDKTRVISLVQGMSMGDMPDLDAVMRPAVEALLARRDAATRHVIVSSDFDPAPPRDDLIKTMKDAGITCSTVCIGFGGHFIDVNKASWIATQTGGRVYTPNDYSKLPQIFIKESKIVRRSLINETPFVPEVGGGMPSTISGLTGEGVPELGGYVLTTAKPLAEVALAHSTEDGPDPVLTQWRVGLGKAVAFTSGMWTRWGAAWAGWPKFSKLWSQLARWASRPSEAAKFDVSTSVQGGRGRIQLDALDKNADSINFMTLTGTLVGPDSDARPIQLIQTGPGRYEAEFDADRSGSYVLNLAYRIGQGAEAAAGTLQTGLSVAFSAEYRELRSNDSLLRELAAKTDGRLLDLADASATFDHAGLRDAEARRSIWEDLIRWMLLLFLLDVAVRRIAIHPVQIARHVRRFVAEIAGRGRAEESAAVLSTLKGARQRSREAAEPERPGAPQPSRAARFESQTAEARSTQELSEALGGATEQERPVVARPTRKPAPQTEADFTSRLLKAKRRAQEDLNKGQGSGEDA
ncbi:MAG: VWA domain-containing protein [Phycisphaerae bacterium]